MLAHHVLFWLKDDATVERDVIDASYSFSLFAAFETMEQFETYQKHPEHIAFLNGPNKLAKRVLIYDAD